MKRAAVAFPTCWTALLSVGGGSPTPGTGPGNIHMHAWLLLLARMEHVCITGAWENQMHHPKAIREFKQTRSVPTCLVFKYTSNGQGSCSAPEPLCIFRNYHHIAEHPSCAWAGSPPPSRCPPSGHSLFVAPTHSMLVALCGYDNQKRLQARPRHPWGQN